MTQDSVSRREFTVAGYECVILKPPNVAGWTGYIVERAASADDRAVVSDDQYIAGHRMSRGFSGLPDGRSVVLVASHSDGRISGFDEVALVLILTDVANALPKK